ncbi:hypothetical protein PINS_up001363 [Pythium insidiosum]|nr:hypothetical protein PINS_up001363 [Pythium insidiosum]
MPKQDEHEPSTTNASAIAEPQRSRKSPDAARKDARAIVPKQVIRAIKQFATISSPADLAAKLLTIVVALCAAAVAVIVLIEIGTLLTEDVMAALRAKQDAALQVLRDALVAMDEMGAAGLGDGHAKASDGMVFAFETTLGPHYDDERAVFKRYVDAIDARRYLSLHGQTRSLFANVSAIWSAMGGVDFGPDWWETVRSYVDIEGGVMFSGNSVDKTLMARNYSDLVSFLGVDPANPVLSDAMIDKLLPRSAIPKRTQLGEFKYKLYSTDPEKLDSFNVHVATDAWLQNLGGADVKRTATCRLLPRASIPKFTHVFGAFWCARSFRPSASYASRFNDATVGLWVIECDSKTDIDLRLDILRWNGKMPQRYSTAFYHNAVRLTSPRKTLYTQTMLANLTAYPSGKTYPIRDVVAAASSGTLEPLPATVYIVQTEPIPNRLRTAILGIALLCVLFTRCTLTGVRTLCHFVLESSLSIALDVAYAVLTYPSGTELAVMIATARHAQGLAAVVQLAIVLRRFSTPALIVAKTVLSLRFGFRAVTPCITIREAIALVVIQIIAIYISAGRVVGVGMRAGTTSDGMTAYVWNLQGVVWLIAIGFILVRFQVGRLVDRWAKRRGAPRITAQLVAQAKSKGAPNATASVDKGQLATDSRSSSSAYDDYLSGKFLSFGVCFLEGVTVQGRPCRVLDGSPLILDCLFNFNLNGLGQYGAVQQRHVLAHVSPAGRFEATDIALDAEYPRNTGNVVIG